MNHNCGLCASLSFLSMPDTPIQPKNSTGTATGAAAKPTTGTTTATTAAKPATGTATAAKPPAATAQTPAANDPKAKPAANQPAKNPSEGSVPKLSFPPSPIQKQNRDPRFGPDYQPLRITILSGEYTGKQPDLGVAVIESNTQQSAEWSDQQGDTIRPGSQFTRIGTRTWSVKLTFYDLNADVSHLVENIFHLHEITDGAKTPPLLLLEEGDLRATYVVCTDISARKSDPLPARGGYRFAEVDLNLKMFGGRGNPNALGAPLTGTPLSDWRRTKTTEQRTKEAQATKAQLLLAPCLGQAGSDALVQIIDKNKQNDVSAIIALPSATFVQAAAAGIFSKETLNKPEIQEKLKNDLAQTLSRTEDGVTFYGRALGEALVSGNPATLPQDLQGTFTELEADYKVILESVSKSDPTSVDVSKHPTAYKRMTRSLTCGLELRASGAPSLANPTKEDAKMLESINNFLKSKSDEEIKTAFGVKTDGQLKALKSAAPYTSQTQFLADAARGGQGITGYALWHTFSETLTDKEKKAEKKEEAK